MSGPRRQRRGAEPLRLLVVSDRITATQFISFLQPLRSLVEEARISLHMLDCPGTTQGVQEEYLKASPDYLILSRCTLAVAKEFIKLARDHNIPYIYHIDDDLLNVPSSLGAAKFKAYNDPKRMAMLENLMRAADVVYTSTASLKAAFGRFQPETTEL